MVRKSFLELGILLACILGIFLVYILLINLGFVSASATLSLSGGYWYDYFSDLTGISSYSGIVASNNRIFLGLLPWLQTNQSDFEMGELSQLNTTLVPGDIKIELYNPIGNGIAITSVTGVQNSLQAIPDNSGGAIFIWTDFRSGNGDIYAQRINSNGEVQWQANGTIISTMLLTGVPFEIVSDNSGGAIITWPDGENLYAQKINSSGASQWPGNGTAVTTAQYVQYDPQITSDSSGGAIITWEDRRNENRNYIIYAQKLNSNGEVQWTPNGTAISTINTSQEDPQLVSDGNGGAIITWYGTTRTTSGVLSTVYANSVDSAGNYKWGSNALIVSSGYAWKSFPQIVSDSSGGAIIVWQDFRNGNYDIYAQKVSSSGSFQISGSLISSVYSQEQEQQKKIKWGAISWTENLPAGTDITFQTQTSKDSIQWSKWSSVIGISGSKIISPPGNYIRYKANFATSNPEVTPILSDVTIVGKFA